MVDLKDVIIKWKSNDEGLTLKAYREKYHPAPIEQEEPKASAPVTSATITNVPRNITYTRFGKERMNQNIRSKISLSLFRLLEDYTIENKLTISSAVREILIEYFNNRKEVKHE